MSTAKKVRTVLTLSVITALIIVGVTIALSVANSAEHSLFYQMALGKAELQEKWSNMGDTRAAFQRIVTWGLPALALVYQLLLAILCREAKPLMLRSGLSLLIAWLVGAGAALAITYAVLGYNDADTYLYLARGAVRTAIVWAVTAVLYWLLCALLKKKNSAEAQ
ncbi:MAG: hypothetical protein ACI3VB_08385 [Oscillospiraceae bacterium]